MKPHFLNLINGVMLTAPGIQKQPVESEHKTPSDSKVTYTQSSLSWGHTWSVCVTLSIYSTGSRHTSLAEGQARMALTIEPIQQRVELSLLVPLLI